MDKAVPGACGFVVARTGPRIVKMNVPARVANVNLAGADEVGQQAACSSDAEESRHWRKSFHDFRNLEWTGDVFEAEQVFAQFAFVRSPLCFLDA